MFESPTLQTCSLVMLLAVTLVAKPEIAADEIVADSALHAEARPAKAATFSLDVIRQAVAASHGRLQSLLVEYNAWNVEAESGLHNHTIVAAKGQARYIKNFHARGDEDIIDSFAHESFYDGVWWNVYVPQSHQYQISRRFAVPPYTRKARVEAFLESLGWWPPGDLSEPPRSYGRPLFVQHVLAQESCQVAAEQEKVGGRWCHVVQAPGDRLWIDVARGTLMRRELQADGEPPLTSTFEFSDLKEVSPGIWLPFSIHRKLPVHSLESLFKVVKYEVNNVPDSRFSYTPGPGTVVIDRDSDELRQIPGGLFFLETICQRALEVLKTHEKRRPEHSRLPWLLAMFACGVGTYGLMSLLRRLTKRQNMGREADAQFQVSRGGTQSQ